MGKLEEVALMESRQELILLKSLREIGFWFVCSVKTNPFFLQLVAFNEEME